MMMLEYSHKPQALTNGFYIHYSNNTKLRVLDIYSIFGCEIHIDKSRYDELIYQPKLFKRVRESLRSDRVFKTCVDYGDHKTTRSRVTHAYQGQSNHSIPQELVAGTQLYLLNKSPSRSVHVLSKFLEILKLSHSWRAMIFIF